MKIKDREERFRLAIEGSLDGLWDWNLRTDEAYHSDRFATMLGYKPDELPYTSTAWSDLLHPDDKEAALQSVEEYLARKVDKYESVFRMRAKDGTYRWIIGRGKALFDDNGTPLRFVGFNTDITELKEAEEKLRTNERRWTMAQRVAKLGNWEVDLKTGMVWGSEMALDIFGIQIDHEKNPEQVLPLDIIETHIPDRENVHQALVDLVENNTPYEMVYKVIRAENQEEVFVISKAERLDDENGNPVKILGTIQDITERKRIDDELLESRTELQNLINAIPDMVWASDENECFTFASESWKTIAGYDPAELIGRSFYELMVEEEETSEYASEEYRDGVKEKFDDLKVERESYQDFLNWNYHKSGEKRCHSSSAVPRYDSEGNFRGYIGVDKDITERIQAAEALQEREQRYYTLLKNLDGMVYRCKNDPDWTMEFVSEGCFSLTGYQPDELEGNRVISFNDLILPEYREYLWNLWQERLSEHQPVEVEYRIKTANGEIRWVWERGIGVFDNKNNLLHLEGYITDITKRKLAEEEGEKLQHQLHHAQKMETVGRLAGGVAHDFNNMLSAILGNVELAKMTEGLCDPILDELDEIEQAALRSADLIRQLLGFARKQTAIPKVLDLNQTIGGMLRMLQRLIGENINLTWTPSDGLWPVYIDPSQIDQVLTNLLVNSRDAIDGIGKVSISTSNTTIGKTDIRLYPELSMGDYVLFCVKDTGVGMDSTVLENLFEPFYTTKPQGEGTGLGLATVFGIIKQNGGFIRVESEVDRGTSFFVYLPKYTGKSSSRQESTQQETIRHGQETILMVEDEQAILSIGKRILDTMGYTVLTANSPGEAMQIVSDFPDTIHLVITDVLMPDMNGKDLVSKLKLRHPGIRSLFMSGYSADIINQNGVVEEEIHFIQKPFTVRALSNKVREVLDLQ